MGHILVTGASGFIGSHLVERLVELKKQEARPEEILCLVRHSSDLSSLKGLGIKLVIGDLGDPESLIPAVQGAAYIYHLGAELYTISKQRFLETNTIGTENLLKIAVRYARSSLKRFLLVSSQAAAGPAPGNESITEATEFKEPISWYADSKQKAEKIARQYAVDLPITIVRPCTVYGPRDPASASIFTALRYHIHPRTGFKTRYTGMVFAPDLVQGMIMAAEHPKTVNEIYFLANPQNYSVKEMVKIIAKGMGKPVGIPLPVPIFVFYIIALFMELIYLFTRKKPIPSRDKVRDISQIFWLCSPQKAREGFGWTAQTSLLEGAKLTFESIKKREKELKNMTEESKGILMIKYFFLALATGIVVELLARFGNVYEFNSIWLALGIIVIFWGVIFGGMSMVTRKCNILIQFLPGFVLLLGGELLNHYFINGWRFPNNELYGITNPVFRAIALGIGAGFLIPLINYIMKRLCMRKRCLG